MSLDILYLYINILKVGRKVILVDRISIDEYKVIMRMFVFYLFSEEYYKGRIGKI